MNSRKLQFADRGVNKNIRKIKMPMLKTLILVGYKRRPNWIPEKKEPTQNLQESSAETDTSIEYIQGTSRNGGSTLPGKGHEKSANNMTLEE